MQKKKKREGDHSIVTRDKAHLCRGHFEELNEVFQSVFRWRDRVIFEVQGGFREINRSRPSVAEEEEMKQDYCMLFEAVLLCSIVVTLLDSLALMFDYSEHSRAINDFEHVPRRKQLENTA